MAVLGWGILPYGLGPWGSLPTGTVYVANARAVSTREVDVTFSDLVQDNANYLAGDALNPLSWHLIRLDTSEVFHILQVTQVSTYTYRILTLEEFGPISVTHRVTAITVLDTFGQLLTAPKFFDFFGITDEDKKDYDAILAKRQTAVRDYSNVQVPDPEYTGGTLKLNAGGDYETETGASLVKKLIYRRLMTIPGDFFHIPDYGVGLRVKEPVSIGKISSLKKGIQQQILQEPEVKAAAVSVTISATGILSVIVNATLKQTGQSVSVGVTLNQQTVVL